MHRALDLLFCWGSCVCGSQLLERKRQELQKREESAAKLREIGTVPSDVDKYKLESRKRVGARARACGLVRG